MILTLTLALSLPLALTLSLVTPGLGFTLCHLLALPGVGHSLAAALKLGEGLLQGLLVGEGGLSLREGSGGTVSSLLSSLAIPRLGSLGNRSQGLSQVILAGLGGAGCHLL